LARSVGATVKEFRKSIKEAEEETRAEQEDVGAESV
jgi:Sec-independent protein translocase protein TatA